MDERSEDPRAPNQKYIQLLASFVFLAAMILPSLDHRFLWSAVPPPVGIAGDILTALGFLIVFLVFKENTFTAATIVVVPDQKVVSTGPYAIVRHPMYSGALVMLFGTPLALGSWWGLLMFVPMTFTIAWRARDEEGFLAKNLSGYKEYCRIVRYRLVPFAGQHPDRSLAWHENPKQHIQQQAGPRTNKQRRKNQAPYPGVHAGRSRHAAAHTAEPSITATAPESSSASLLSSSPRVIAHSS